MALKAPKRTFSNVKKVIIIFCLISQEESDIQNVFVTLQWNNCNCLLPLLPFIYLFIYLFIFYFILFIFFFLRFYVKL